MNLLCQSIIRFCYFCKMAINKTIVIGIFLPNRSYPYEFNASIELTQITSQVNVIAPSTVLTTQNAKLIPSPNLCHSLMLFRITRSQRTGVCVKETLWRPTSISRDI